MRLSGALEDIKDGLQKAAVVPFDETDLRLGGKLRRPHFAGTADLTCYDCREKRGKDGMVKAYFSLPTFALLDFKTVLCGLRANVRGVHGLRQSRKGATDARCLRPEIVFNKVMAFGEIAGEKGDPVIPNVHA